MSKLRAFTPYLSHAAPYLAPGLFLLVLPVTHTVALRLLMLLITLVMATLVFARGERSRPPCLISWALWLGVALFSLTTAVDQSYSIGEIKTEIGYGFVAFLAFFVLTRRWRDYVVFTAVLLTGFWILGVPALIDSFSGGAWRRDSFYGGVGDFSSYLVNLLPLLVLLAFQLRKSYPTLTPVLSILTGLLFLLLAYQTRNLMVWPALVLQIVALLLLAWRGRVWHKLIVLFACFALMLSLLIAVGAQKSRVSDLTPQGIAGLFTQDPRIQHWRNVTEVISRQPWHGDGFGRAALSKAHPEVRIRKELWHSHNVFLDAAVQMGLQGALALALLFGCPAWRFNRLRLTANPDLHTLGVAGLVLLVGVLSKNMTDNFFYRHLSLMFWSECGMLLGLARSLLLEQRRADKLNPPAESSPADA